MKYTVHGRAAVEADSPGAAEEIAQYEHVGWEVIKRGWLGRQAAKVLAVMSVGWVATGPIWDDGAVAVLTGHAARALAPIGALVALVAG